MILYQAARYQGLNPDAEFPRAPPINELRMRERSLSELSTGLGSPAV
jgi:hypothetical protein